MLFEFKVNDDIIASSDQRMTLKKDKTYIANKFWTKRIPISSQPIPIETKDYKIDININDKKLLIIMSSGLGDVLFLTPLINTIKQKYPNCYIGFATAKPNQDILQIIDNINQTIDYPIDKEKFDTFDYVIRLEDLSKTSEENKERNIYELFLEHIGITDIQPEMCRPYIKENVLKNIEVKENLIGIHPFATDHIRHLNFNLVLELCKKLDYNIVLFSNKKEMEEHQHRFQGTKVKWAIQSINNIMSTTRLLAQCEFVIATDSVITHLAQAIGKKCICLYGPFSANSRVKYYENITIIDNNPDCRCALHQFDRCPKGFSNSPCLFFDPDMIIDIINDTAIIQHPTLLNNTVTKYNWENNNVKEEEITEEKTEENN